MTKDNCCTVCGKKLIDHGKPKEDFETHTVMTGKKKDKPIRKLLCSACKTDIIKKGSDSN